MPNWFPSYTNCSQPSGWSGPPYSLMAGITAGGLVGGGLLILALFAGISGPLVLAGLIASGLAVALAAACLAGILFCNWWLDVRLICLGGDRSAVGVIYKPGIEPPAPPPSLLNPAAPFNVGDYDTDYSFNFLLWPFIPQDEFPQSFVDTQWQATAVPQLETAWPPSTVHSSAQTNPLTSPVADQINLIVPQQSMASLNLGFTGQNVSSSNPNDQPPPPPQKDPLEHFLLHCEIEGPGIEDLRTLLYVLMAVFIAAAAAYLIPGIGPLISLIATILAFLAFLIGGNASMDDQAQPPDNSFGGPINPFDSTSNNDPKATVDILYAYGRWVYDSFHQPVASNELHPLHFLIVIDQATQPDLSAGIWPVDIPTLKASYDQQFGIINLPGTVQIQAEPQNQWTLHPVLDGCQGATPYPIPPPPQMIE